MAITNLFYILRNESFFGLSDDEIMHILLLLEFISFFANT